MRVLIDTNVFLVAVSRKSHYHWLFNAFLNEKFEIALTTEILAEYEEQFTLHWDKELSQDVMNVLVEAPNIFFCTVYYQFNLISADPDDNKFADCAVAAGADYIITFDKHFNSLKKLSFPSINIIHPDDFKTVLNS